ncbi:hypothetical protein M2T31_28900, partial [Klebsiella pneumoniae]|nr:hypothetical protein [Klebsiella pneumoniae]
SLLMARATFGVGFFMRPVGGVLLGLYADRRGRKAAMQLIILLMTLSIAMIAFAHKQLGLPLDEVFMVQMAAVALMTLVIPLAGGLSDRVGRRPVLLVATLAFMLMVYPL